MGPKPQSEIFSYQFRDIFKGTKMAMNWVFLKGIIPPIHLVALSGSEIGGHYVGLGN